ncbi:PaaX family transcriptional regulator C-terminal domain-containing protein [Gordonia phthalatica]|uniref:PaaX family transcriptional regulator n=1 Tax=Gordonia phthalatica TaxID=1136941 RepID=A0A0N9NBB7_9ACTN|nr:PaaX family transcriptional regulator C-terminal domain-containing protein [Gordonia phthalatica]ALG84890.1 PaaX family transcriptional regulator [Gordonia phthalatica]
MTSDLVPSVSARSAVLSLLLGVQPPSLSAREIVGAMGLFGIAESTTRVALTRMTSNGDLTRIDGVYTLSERLIRRQHDSRPPDRVDWDGTWEMAVITTVGRSAANRTALRATLRSLRVGELREGVWMRPANLRRPWPDDALRVSTRFDATPTGDPAELVRRLWDVDTWAARGFAYLDAIAEAGDEPTRFVTMVAAVNHLNTDPLLPPELRPKRWPGEAITAVYDEYRAWLTEQRDEAFAPETH